VVHTADIRERGLRRWQRRFRKERRSSNERNEPEPPDRGCAVVLWLFAVLIAEVEALLWLFERTYAQ
jgi:hypothetical protein